MVLEKVRRRKGEKVREQQDMSSRPKAPQAAQRRDLKLIRNYKR